MLRHDAGHLIIDPIFASEYYKGETSDCFVALDIDDCDCETCSIDRGPIPKYATINLGIVAGNARVSQRLTIHEAKKLAKTLLAYTKVLDAVAEADKSSLEENV